MKGAWLQTQEKVELIKMLSELKKDINSNFKYTTFEKLISRFLFVMNYCILCELFDYLLKKSRINYLTKTLKKWAFFVESINKDLKIKPYISKNLNHIYLAVLLSPAEKTLSKKNTITTSNKLSSYAPLRFTGEPKSDFSFHSEESKHLESLEEHLPEYLISKDSNQFNRMDCEESYPLLFRLSGQLKLMNPLKIQFNDPRFIVFYQMLKRIVLPNLSKGFSRANRSEEGRDARHQEGGSAAVRCYFSAN